MRHLLLLLGEPIVRHQQFAIQNILVRFLYRNVPVSKDFPEAYQSRRGLQQGKLKWSGNQAYTEKTRCFLGIAHATCADYGQCGQADYSAGYAAQ